MISPEIAKLATPKDAQSTAALQVDVIADFVCPWSFLGKRRLDEALASVHGPSTVSWLPFQVNPQMSSDGEAFNDYLRTRFGDPAALKPGLDALTERGAKEGVRFRFDRIERVPSTLNAHVLMHLAETHGLDTGRLADALYRSFFEFGRDISDPDVLVGLGAVIGLDGKTTRAAFEDESTKRIVLAQEAQVRQNGVSGVPDFLVNKRLFVVGAQTTVDFVKVFDRVMFGEDSDLEMSDSLH